MGPIFWPDFGRFLPDFRPILTDILANITLKKFLLITKFAVNRVGLQNFIGFLGPSGLDDSSYIFPFISIFFLERKLAVKGMRRS